MCFAKKTSSPDDHDIQILTENIMGLEEVPNALNKNGNQSYRINTRKNYPRNY